MRIAIIDDDEDCHELLRQILCDFDIEFYFSGEEVFRRYHKQEHEMPNTFVVDYYLNNELGTEAIKRLGLSDFGMLIIGMTNAYDDPSIVKAFHNVHCHRVIPKDRLTKLPQIVNWMCRKRTTKRQKKDD